MYASSIGYIWVGYMADHINTVVIKNNTDSTRSNCSYHPIYIGVNVTDG